MFDTTPLTHLALARKVWSRLREISEAVNKMNKAKQLHEERERIYHRSKESIVVRRRSDAQVNDLVSWVVSSKMFPRTVPHEVLLDICKHMQGKTIKRGETLFLQGDIGDFFYIILTGSIDLFLNDNPDDEVRDGFYDVYVVEAFVVMIMLPC